MKVIFIIIVAFIGTLHVESTSSSIEKRDIIRIPLCVSIAICRIKCKRYLIRNNCPICECNPCLYGQPLSNISCGHGERKCLAAGGICKTHSWYDKPYCCPNEHDGCCPAIPVDKIPPRDPNILFPCFRRCSSDGDCQPGYKCCGTCPPRCLQAFIP
ncbi:unnamed protein product [Rotaria sp. Silwood2]|nr:unnamed protein product [Rotaria sp. Silwood2]CAF3906745.1 unnamed protein product [Rotaria sp. Silwood2]